MSKTKLIVIAVIIVGLAAYALVSWLGEGEPQPQEEAVVEQQATSEPAVTVDFIGEQTGVATILELNGLAQVQYGFIDAPEGIIQPAHIHAGSCANLGEIKYLLNFPVDDISVTDLDVTLAELKTQLPLAINVHQSLEDIGMSIACADIVF